LPSAIAACNAEKSGRPLWSTATISPSINVRRPLLPLQSLKTCPPSPALARIERDLAVLDTELHAIAVEFDSWHHAPPLGGRSTEAQSCGGTKSGIAETFFALAAPTNLRLRPRFAAEPRLNSRLRPLWFCLGQHERLWGPALAVLISAIVRPEATERSSRECRSLRLRGHIRRDA
jgi:hypothetical protein